MLSGGRIAAGSGAVASRLGDDRDRLGQGGKVPRGRQKPARRIGTRAALWPALDERREVQPQTVGALVKVLLATGMDYGGIVEAVRARFPDARTGRRAPNSQGQMSRNVSAAMRAEGRYGRPPLTGHRPLDRSK